MQATADQFTVRQHNSALIVRALRQHQTLSRAELAAETGLNRSTVSSIVNDLIQQHMMEETTYQSDRIGRPGLLLTLNPSYGCTIGIEVNVDYLAATLLDFTYRVIWQARTPLTPGLSPADVIMNGIAFTQEAIQEAQYRRIPPLGIGVVLPALIDTHRGAVTLGPNLGWQNISVLKYWQAQFDLPILVENDANAAAVAEHYLGNARNVENFVLITGGVGIGGGIMVDGKLMRGQNGYAAEVGHMVVDPEGQQCGCGSQGCLETVIGNTIIVEETRQLLRTNKQPSRFTAESIDTLNFDDIVQAGLDNDPVCRLQLQKIAYHLGLVVSQLGSLFNPEMIIIGGYSHCLLKFLIPEIKIVAQKHSMQTNSPPLNIQPSHFGVNSSVIGAAALVYDHLSQPVFSNHIN
ncbi:MAG TPA: ROK family protein [Chloroflexi bacterium]|nr:ROK family protein [Chloroflexota bacterium]